MISNDFFAHLKCTLCGKEGNWPFIPFKDSGEYASARPADCAAVIITDKLIAKEALHQSLHPDALNADGVNYDVFCPDCFRIGTTDEENGQYHNMFNGLTPVKLFNTLRDSFERPTTQPETVYGAFQKAIGDHSMMSQIDLSRHQSGSYSANFKINLEDGVDLAYILKIHAMPESDSNRMAVYYQLETRMAFAAGDEEGLPLFNAYIPDEKRVEATCAIYELFALLYKKMRSGIAAAKRKQKEREEREKKEAAWERYRARTRRDEYYYDDPYDDDWDY